MRQEAPNRRKRKARLCYPETRFSPSPCHSPRARIPERLRRLYETKDYGRWAVKTTSGCTTVPTCFLATNHTTGGNSGSPIINGRGELVGINFDRTWRSTMSDIEFDPEICRNISVDIRYVLFFIEKYGGAGYLLEEMDLR